jgi:hypothetical protein
VSGNSRTFYSGTIFPCLLFLSSCFPPLSFITCWQGLYII